MRHLILLSMLVTVFSVSNTNAGEASGEASRIGQGKAVEQFDPEQGFKLSSKAMKSMGVKFQALSGKGPWKVPKSSLMTLKQSDAVYRLYDGWISMVLVKVVSADKDTVMVKAEDLETGDQVAVEGVTFLRMTDSDLNAGTVDSCAH
ncbi:hypothetical protein ACLVWU_04655 [Bdellovibrio sp. HCB290]|uniref:hypothetical protein n=1 Tax=Bdellovibrio sp. HCB290 TaxID=3394356 RepID=UPI0039B68994